MAPIRVFIADDHILLRDGLKATLAAEADLDVVGEAADGHEAVALYPALRPDVVLLDVEMPGLDGLACLETLRQMDIACKVLMLTSFIGDARIARALAAGACGYLHKASPKAFIVDAIRHAAAGKRVMSPDVAAALERADGAPELHAREVACLALAAEGLDTREMADRLGVPVDTVKTRLKSAFAKLGVTDRVQAIAKAIERGYI